MNLQFDPRGAALLAERASALAQSASELGAFGEVDPEMAGECGVEICSLEARTILSGGSVNRVIGLASEAARAGKAAIIPTSDLDAISRLEQVVSLGASRIGLRLAAMDAVASQEPKAAVANLIGMATGAIGLYRAIF